MEGKIRFERTKSFSLTMTRDRNEGRERDDELGREQITRFVWKRRFRIEEIGEKDNGLGTASSDENDDRRSEGEW